MFLLSQEVERIGMIFFFQAEDGIRGGHVTGVQTCALPILAGGQMLDQRLVGDVREEGLSVHVVPGEVGSLGTATGSARIVPLHGAKGITEASVVVTTSDARLRSALSDLNELILLAVVFAAAIAVLLALVIAPRLARPISEVADAADKIALGAR